MHSDRESASARLAPPRPAHFEGSGGAQARAKAGQPRQRLAYSRSRRDAASGRRGASWGRGATITQPSRRSQGRFSGFFFYIPPPQFLVFPLFILTSLTTFPASLKFTNTWRSPGDKHDSAAPLPWGGTETKKGIPF